MKFFISKSKEAKKVEEWFEKQEQEAWEIRRQQKVKAFREYLLAGIVCFFTIFITFVPCYFLITLIKNGIIQGTILFISSLLWILLTIKIFNFLKDE